MTLYDLLKQISHIITPEDDSFYNYVLYTSDNNGGFLRTRYCWWDKPLENRKIKESYKRVIVSSTAEIDPKKFLDKSNTYIKMQIHYDIKDASINDVQCDIELGYKYIYIFDLESLTYTLEISKERG